MGGEYGSDYNQGGRIATRGVGLQPRGLGVSDYNQRVRMPASIMYERLVVLCMQTCSSARMNALTYTQEKFIRIAVVIRRT